MCSTLGDVQYTGDVPHTLVFSTPDGYHLVPWECSVHWRDIISTVGGYHEYTVHQRDTMSTSMRYHDECEGYHEYKGGCSVHRGFHTNFIVFPMTLPHINHDIPSVYTHGIHRSTERRPVYCTPSVYCTYIKQGDSTVFHQTSVVCKPTSYRSVIRFLTNLTEFYDFELLKVNICR